MDAIELAIMRVTRSVRESLTRRGWKVKSSRSPKSRSRYVYATLRKRKLVVRISDHRNPAARSDIDIDYRKYEQKRLVAFLERKKNGRSRKK